MRSCAIIHPLHLELETAQHIRPVAMNSRPGVVDIRSEMRRLTPGKARLGAPGNYFPGTLRASHRGRNFADLRFCIGFRLARDTP